MTDKKSAEDPCMKADPPFPIEEVQLPVATFPSRNAPLGVTFVPTGAMDETFEHNAVVALHGSWATLPDGHFVGDKENPSSSSGRDGSIQQARRGSRRRIPWSPGSRTKKARAGRGRLEWASDPTAGFTSPATGENLKA